MEKNITLKVQDLDVIGQLKYGNDNKLEIFLTLPATQSHYLKDLFYNPKTVNFNGKFEDDCEFTAFYCHVISASINLQNAKMTYVIDIGKLYLNAADASDEMIIKKVDVKFSSIEKWLPNNDNKKIFIKQNDCYITISNSFITIEPLHVVTLRQLNQILFNLHVFFEVVVLNSDVQTTKKFIYTVNDKKIEEIMRYKKEEKDNENFLFSYDTSNIENILNHWFETKSKYGRIFDYLSGILNESSIVHLELKYFVLAQWLEAYSRELLHGEVKAIIKEHIKSSDDKELLLSQSQNNNNFRKNLKDMFKLKDLKTLIGIQNSEYQKNFIDQIICYRNHLTHINIESKLNNIQIMYLYETLKDIIYILIIKELDVAIDSKRIDEIKRKYIAYKSLQDTIKKCE